jgi:hypothetical protein
MLLLRLLKLHMMFSVEAEQLKEEVGVLLLQVSCLHLHGPLFRWCHMLLIDVRVGLVLMWYDGHFFLVWGLVDAHHLELITKPWLLNVLALILAACLVTALKQLLLLRDQNLRSLARAEDLPENYLVLLEAQTGQEIPQVLLATLYSLSEDLLNLADVTLPRCFLCFIILMGEYLVSVIFVIEMHKQRSFHSPSKVLHFLKAAIVHAHARAQLHLLQGQCVFPLLCIAISIYSLDCPLRSSNDQYDRKDDECMRNCCEYPSLVKQAVYWFNTLSECLPDAPKEGQVYDTFYDLN